MCVFYPHFELCFKFLNVKTIFHSLTISYCEEGEKRATATR